jgi:hypothetical protein
MEIFTYSEIGHVHIQERNDIKSVDFNERISFNSFNVCRVAEMQPEHKNFQKFFPELLPSTCGGM